MKYRYKLLEATESDTRNTSADDERHLGEESDNDTRRKKMDTKWIKQDENWIEESKKEDERKNGDTEFISLERTRLLSQDGKPSTSHYSDHLSEKEDSSPFPFKVFYIIGSEFCERFSFYGLRTVLVLYLSRELLMTEDSATSFFHGWTFLCYFTPLLGAIIADSSQGRFRTILWLSVVYLLGNIVLSMAATKFILPNIGGETSLSVVGLVLIAFGTGGIKPCVSAFGGDQFELPQQEKQLSKFFSIFYFSINCGSLLSTLLTPILREDVSCFGGECFSLAFAVPAVLMFVALVLFVIGTPHYNIVSPEGNVAVEVFKCIMYAGYRKVTTNISKVIPAHYSYSNDGTKKEITSHWLHLAEDRFSSSLIRDVKVLLRVLLLYLPLPFFWALYDQQASRWTFQAEKMSGSLGSWTIKPDQMQVLNPILILLLIPFFDSVVYPLLSRFIFLTKPLHRMFVGGLLACLAFIVSGILQVAIENPQANPVTDGSVSFAVFNALPCQIRFGIPSSSQSDTISAYDSLVKTYNTKYFRETHTNSSDNVPTIKMEARSHDQSAECKSLIGADVIRDIQIYPEQKEVFAVVTSYLGKLTIVLLPDTKTGIGTGIKFKDTEGISNIRMIDSTDFLRLSSIKLLHGNRTVRVKSDFFSEGISSAETELLSGARYEVVLPNLLDEESREKGKSLGFFFASSSTVLFLYKPISRPEVSNAMKVFNVAVPSIHMFWLLPQYLLMAMGEIMFSITGLEFSFRQAPLSMKSVVQAAWLLNNAFGNLYVVIISESKLFQKQSLEFFLFAGLMFVDMLIFYGLARTFHLQSKKEEEEDEEEIYNRIAEESSDE